MIVHPSTLDEAAAAGGEYRAGGTDLEGRRRLGLVGDPTVDLRRVEGLAGIERLPDGGARIGALTRLGAIAADPELGFSYPALRATAGSLANPHTRAVGTLGGNLAQRNRCWYYRTGRVGCYKAGGDDCPARRGHHPFGVVFDTGRCVSPHPSTLALALLAYEARLLVHGGPDRPVADLYGDGADPSRDHLLAAEEIIAAVELPPPTPGERAAYRRATSRVMAEWPLVEAVCRMVVEEDTITLARVAVGAVAPVPLRLSRVEARLEGGPPTSERLAEAAALASVGARPLPQTGYKVPLVEGTVLEVLEAAASGDDHTEATFERAL